MVDSRTAARVRVRGVVQGVGFRPFVYRIARSRGLVGWVLNGEAGVEIHVEGSAVALGLFLDDLNTQPPPAARIAEIETTPVPAEGFVEFVIRESEKQGQPTVRVSPDLPVCAACLRELFDPDDRRYLYPYINCTDCGPRYSIIRSLPYDRPRTTMRDWPLCSDCAREYHDPADRRFHAQPVACPVCGPTYTFRADGGELGRGQIAVEVAARWLVDGRVLAVKGLGGYHLACDARNGEAVWALRERKFRKEKPFALMARDLAAASALVDLSPEAEALLESTPRPIVLAPARVDLPGVAPDNPELGVMLPYTPLHHLLFAAGAPEALVMTSANLSDEPIAYDDADALDRLSGIADGFLIGERPIARRVDDSVTRVGPFGPVIPACAGLCPSQRGSPADESADPRGRGGSEEQRDPGGSWRGVRRSAPRRPRAPCRLPGVRGDGRGPLPDVRGRAESLLVVHDRHPEYASTRFAQSLLGERLAVQHHRAHIASVLAERGAWESRVIGFAFDGTGYGDDGSIWGGEVFVGSLGEGLSRAIRLRTAALPGGDAAARFPGAGRVGFLAQVPGLPDLTAPPFGFPDRYRVAAELVRKGVRTFPTTSVGRLFDSVAALVGFTRGITFEGQAAIWLEHLAHRTGPTSPYPLPIGDDELDFRPLLEAVIEDRRRGRDVSEIARSFHESLAAAVEEVSLRLGEEHGIRIVALSGGVFQNGLLLALTRDRLSAHPELTVWTNQAVPPNDGGISLGQAALGAMLATPQVGWIRAHKPTIRSQ